MGLVSSRRNAAVLAVPMILVAVAVFATANVERNAALRGASEQETSQRMLTAVLDEETGARGFFQTHQQRFLEPWSEGTASYGSALTELRSLVEGDTAIERLLVDQARRVTVWHSATQTAIFNLEQTGRSQSDADAVRAKALIDGIRASQGELDALLKQKRSSSLSVATAVAVAVAVALAAMLAAGGLLLTRRGTRREEMRQRDQSELRELLQASETEQESRDLLIRHVQKLLPGTGAAVLNRNASDDRLEITGDTHDSLLRTANTEQMRPRSCLAVRLSHPHDRCAGDRGLLQCEICGGIDGAATCEPLLVGGQVIGSVLVASKRALDDERRARLRDSVAQAAPILASQRNLVVAERRAASDALTGLPNRRSADETLKRMAAHAGRSVTPLVAILLDLDRFKALNDTHGHESGDRALALVGRIIGTSLRTSDFAGRYGGEEFLILLPETDRDGAMIVAEKLRGEIEHAELAGIGQITASLGLAVLPADAGDSGELLRKADRALYAAKQNGRNRVQASTRVAADEPTLPA